MHHNRQTSAASLSSAAVAPATAGQRRASTRKPLTSFSTLTISNRNWKLLEIPATPTKHSPDAFSNRNENTQTWGRHSCLRNAAHISMNCARTAPTQRVAQAGVGLCAVVSRAFEKRPSSRGPFTGRRISLRFPSLNPHSSSVTSTHPEVGEAARLGRSTTLSNRHWKRLEIPVTHTKQSPAPILIDTENALFHLESSAPELHTPGPNRPATPPPLC
jgi:hypothetical protein